jgi:isoquinoline 1-oxidoreductase beta subunit
MTAPVTTPISRRCLLQKTAAGLTFALALDPLGLAGEPPAAAPAAPFAPNLWLTIGTDGIITIVSPAAELGQGSFTTLPLILAEELDADWSKVRMTHPPVWDGKKYGNPEYGEAFATTSSFAVWGYYRNMRLAGVQARRVLLDAVAQMWAVPVAELTTEPSVVVHKASGRRIGYGEIVAVGQFPDDLRDRPLRHDKNVPALKDLKDPKAFRLIGHDVPRVDVPLKVTGAAKFGIDVQVPGMVYAAVLQPPYHGGGPVTVDDAAARRVPGVTDVVRLPGGVGVVGTTVEATQAAKKLLKVTWSEAKGAQHDSERALEEFAAIARDKSRTGIAYVQVGAARVAMRGATKVMSGEYRTRYLYHAQMEPLNATVSVAPDGKSAEIWTGTQSPTALHNEVARALKIDPASITFHQHLLGGGFGRRSQQEVNVDAALLSKAVGKPVKLIWSREDDLTFGKFRPMTAHYIEAGFDPNGKLMAWHHRVVAESVGAFMAAVAGRQPAPTDRIVMKGTPLPQYPIPNKLAEHVVEDRGTRLAPWRGVGVGHNAFAIESFLDEIAKEFGKDPVALRLELSQGQPRVQTLLRTVAEMSDWKRPRSGTALGVAFMEKDSTLAAGVAEVSVDRGSGKIKIHNVWVAIDAGLAVQPKNLAAQTEGSIVYGLGHVLREQITIKDGRVQQSNFTDYEPARMSDVPNIEVKVLSTDNPPTGAGEDGLPLLACAVGNAIAALTGVRLRELPFAPERVRGALGA